MYACVCLFCMCMCVCLWVYVHHVCGPQRPEDGVTPGSGVSGSCVPLSGAGTEPGSSAGVQHQWASPSEPPHVSNGVLVLPTSARSPYLFIVVIADLRELQHSHCLKEDALAIWLVFLICFLLMIPGLMLYVYQSTVIDIKPFMSRMSVCSLSYFTVDFTER